VRISSSVGRPVHDRGIDASHENHTAVDLRLKLQNVILRHNALPDVVAEFNHIFNDRLEKRIGMVQDGTPLSFMY
jgi:hypothetical protein